MYTSQKRNEFEILQKFNSFIGNTFVKDEVSRDGLRIKNLDSSASTPKDWEVYDHTVPNLKSFESILSYNHRPITKTESETKKKSTERRRRKKSEPRYEQSD